MDCSVSPVSKGEDFEGLRGRQVGQGKWPATNKVVWVGYLSWHLSIVWGPRLGVSREGRQKLMLRSLVSRQKIKDPRRRTVAQRQQRTVYCFLGILISCKGRILWFGGKLNHIQSPNQPQESWRTNHPTSRGRLYQSRETGHTLHPDTRKVRNTQQLLWNYTDPYLMVTTLFSSLINLCYELQQGFHVHQNCIYFTIWTFEWDDFSHFLFFF